MKRFVTAFLILAATLCFAADSVEVLIDPEQISAKEPAELILRSKTSTPPSFVTMPKISGLIWLRSGTSIQQQIINGNFSIIAERRYSFVVEKEGTYTIPATMVNVNRKQVKIKPLTFTAKKFDADAWASLAKEAGMKYMVPKILFLPV